MYNIDEVFYNVELDQIYPMASMKTLPRIGSDHTLLLWYSGCDTIPKPPIYRFEKWWLMRGKPNLIPSAYAPGMYKTYF
jgi:hypothetical protein